MDDGRLWLLPALIDELDEADIENPDVSVTDEFGWSVGLYPSGRIVLENVEDRESKPIHIFGGRDEQLIAATAIAAGRRDLLQDWPWLPGYG
jgi:hypothetical protein